MSERVSRPRVKPPALLPSTVMKTPDRMPLASLLEPSFSEHTVPLLWHRVQGKLHAPARSRARLPLAFALAGALLALVLLVPQVRGLIDFGRSDDALRLSSGQLPATFLAEAIPRDVVLSDGSRIQVAQQSRLEVVSNDRESFVTALSRGSATFEVKPQANRRWVVEVGLTSVEVVGTRFTVTRSEAEVSVSVERGLVLVRGVAVPGGQQRLGAGQRLRAPTTLDARAQGREPPPAGTRSETGVSAALGASNEAVVEHLEAASPKVLNADEEFRTDEEFSPNHDLSAHQQRAASADSAASGPARPSKATSSAVAQAAVSSRKVPPQIESLLTEADRAREAGDYNRSLQYFEQVIALAPRFDPRRGLAAMSVARMTMRSNPARAAAALRATLEGMPLALQENATARLVEAYAKSGQTKEAQRMAERYLARFPTGRRAEDVRRWAHP